MGKRMEKRMWKCIAWHVHGNPANKDRSIILSLIYGVIFKYCHIHLFSARYLSSPPSCLFIGLTVVLYKFHAYTRALYGREGNSSKYCYPSRLPHLLPRFLYCLSLSYLALRRKFRSVWVCFYRGQSHLCIISVFFITCCSFSLLGALGRD